MRKTLAVLCLLLVTSACAASGTTPTPGATPTSGSSAKPPSGYVILVAQQRGVDHSVNCHQPGRATYGF